MEWIKTELFKGGGTERDRERKEEGSLEGEASGRSFVD
jgi:hypothetical protein